MKFRNTIFLALGLLFISCSEERKGIKPEIKTITESVYASVTIRPQGMYEAFSSMPGIIDQYLVEEGDTVIQGQTIVTLIAESSSVNLESAQLNADLAQENFNGRASLLESLETEIQSAEEQLKIDSLNYFRQKRLWTQGIGALTDLESRKLKYEQSSNTVQNLIKQKTQSANDLRNSVKQAQNKLKNAQTTLGDYSIKARMNGTVYSLLKEEGEMLSQQSAVAQIGSTDSFQIDMLIDEVDVAKIQINQQILLSLDAYPTQVFEAAVTKILPLKDERSQTFTVEGRFIDMPDVLYAGLSGEANILISTKEQSMVIPADYLLAGDKVLTEDGESQVSIGMRNIDKVEILSGIDSSTVILKP